MTTTTATDEQPEPLFDGLSLDSQRLATIGRFGVGLAHDLNNLLTAIGGYVDLETAEAEGLKPLNRDEVRLLIARGKELTQRYLELTQGKPQADPLLDLGTEVQALVTNLGPFVPRNVELDIERSQEPLLVRIDRGHLEQVLMNLTLNACDAMGKGGRLQIKSLRNGEYGCLELVDEGAGIPPKLRKKVLEPFFTTKPKGKGTGLGLAICKHIAHISGGLLEFDGAPGGGTTARLRLPLVRSSKANQPANEADGVLRPYPGKATKKPT